MFLRSLKMVCIVLVSAFELLYSVICFSFLKRDMITVFGGHKISKTDNYGKDAYQVSYRMVKEGYGIFTGGGSGIMKEAHHGAYDAKRDYKVNGTINVGINLKNLKEGKSDKFADYFISVRTFFVRKWLLMRFSVEFIIFPGGFGTLDEFAELITLLKTKSMDNRKIILFGKEYWTGFLDWFEKQSVQKGLSSPESLNLFQIVDSVDEAVEVLKICCENIKR